MKKFILLAVALLFLAGCSFSEGERHGTITKFSKKGYVFKTWEGEMITGGEGSSANGDSVFKFSVPDKKIQEKVIKAMRAGKTCSLIYEQQYFVFWWEGDTDYFIVDVQ